MRLENFNGYTLESHDGPLPTVEGKVDGIVGWEPAKVQCYECHRTMTGPSAILVIQWALFNPLSGLPGRRCAECWLAAGWKYSGSGDWEQVPPKPRQ